ncbi:hypothetical protein B296_00037734 [Ensete ventricosum]|uniref:Uncharacterized protein n=1 Tax=Ensete ventricosum TaxID=4639 RepID=A0A426Z7R5_ENSVE|nr:hypothetical protein B296_00037734 [Ensete ventricosum]
MRTARYQVGVVSAPITIIAARYTEGEEKEEPAYLASLSFDIPIHRRPLLPLVVRMLPRRRQRLLLIRTGRSCLDDVVEASQPCREKKPRRQLAKAREQAVVLEAAVVRAEERARILEADAEARLKDASEKALAAAKEKEDLLALVNILQSQVERFAS